MGAIKTISHTTSDYRWPRISQIGSEHLGVAFEEYTGSTFYANLMAIGISNFDDINIWRLDSDTSRAEIRPVVASDIADYPAAPYIYAAYVSLGKNAEGDDNTWVYVKRSENGGQTWTSPIYVQFLDLQCPDITIALAIKGDVLYCAYTTGGPYSWAGSYNIQVRTSLDYGNTWSAGASIANTSAEERFPGSPPPPTAGPFASTSATVPRAGPTMPTPRTAAPRGSRISCWPLPWSRHPVPRSRATDPSAFFYVSYFDTYTETVHLKRAPYADPNASAWTYLGNAKTTANALSGDQTPALVAKIHPNGGFGGALAWRSGARGMTFISTPSGCRPTA